MSDINNGLPTSSSTIASGDLHAVTVRLDMLHDILIELAAALTADRAAGVATAIGNRLNQRL